MHAMAFHTHKTKIHGPLPHCPTHIPSALSSTAFWGYLEGVICSLHATIPTCQAKYVHWYNSGMTVMGVTRGVEICYEVFS